MSLFSESSAARAGPGAFPGTLQRVLRQEDQGQIAVSGGCVLFPNSPSPSWPKIRPLLPLNFGDIRPGLGIIIRKERQC